MATRILEPGRYWSHTLGKDIEACERRVFYRVWKSWGGWAPGSGTSRLIYLAKNTDTLPTYVGSLVHEAVRRTIERVRAGMKLADDARVVARLEERIRHDVAWSERREWKGLRNPKRATLILYEHLVGRDLHEWQIDEAIERGKASLEGFFAHWFPRIRKLSPEQILLVDSLDKFDVDGFEIFCSPDVVFFEEEPNVVDWKTGRGTDGEQLEAYFLHLRRWYARKNLPVPEHAKGTSVPLAFPGEELQIKLDARSEERALARIRVHLEWLRQRQASGRSGDEISFEKTSMKDRCEGCRFEFHCALQP